MSYLEACWLVNFVSGQTEFETSLEFGYKSDYHMLTHKASLFALYRKICFLNYPCCIPYSLIIKSMSYLEACWLVNFVSGQTEFETSLEFGYKSENARINGFGFETESEVFSPLYWKIF